MPDTQRRQLNKQGRSGTTIHGGCAILFSLPFLLGGIAIILVSADIIPQPDENFGAPRPVVGLLGGIFGAAGLWLCIHGIRGLLRKLRTRRLAELHPDDMWRADYNWSETGASDGALWKAVKPFLQAAALAVFLAPFNYFVFLRDEAPGFAMAIVGLFDLVLVGIIGWGVYLVLRFLKYGPSFLRFKRFPFFLGEMLETELRTPRGYRTFSSMQITLRCVEERYEKRGTGRNRSEKVVCYQVWADAITIEGPGAYGVDASLLPVTFELPADGKSTCLAERPPVYWEIEIAADAPGVDYKAVFLVPVYARPSNYQNQTLLRA